MKCTILTVLLFCKYHILFSQIAGYNIPKEYIAKMGIKKITECELAPLNDTTINLLYFNKKGEITQRTSYFSKDLNSDIGLDTNYKGNKVAFYECFTYDNKGRLKISSSSWTGIKEPYILINEYLYSNDGDTTYMKSFNDLTGESSIWTSPHLNNIDTVDINKNCIAFVCSNKDTIGYKFFYHLENIDSTIYSLDFNKSYYRYYVFKDQVLVKFGIMNHSQDGSNTLLSVYQLFFNNDGLPYKSSLFDNSKNSYFISEIKVETY
jgi:hypothetical protein